MPDAATIAFASVALALAMVLVWRRRWLVGSATRFSSFPRKGRRC
jgi:hypothetical protein